MWKKQQKILSFVKKERDADNNWQNNHFSLQLHFAPLKYHESLKLMIPMMEVEDN